MRLFQYLIGILAGGMAFAHALAQNGIVYGEAGGQQLTMDFYPPAGKGPHPVVIIIHGGGFVGGTSKNGSEAYCADFLAPSGYAVFSINYRLMPKFTLGDMVDDVHTAVRFIREHAGQWDADPARIALLGGSAGGYLSNMAPLMGSDRGTAVQAVVTLFGISNWAGMQYRANLEPMFEPTLSAKGWRIAESEWSPISHLRSGLPPFLLIHGDKDEAVPLAQSIELQKALQALNVRCDLIVIPNGPHATGSWYRIPGVPDWEKQLTEWLNQVLHHEGPIGEGIRPREPASTQ